MSQEPGIRGIEDTPRGRLLSSAARLFRAKGFDRTTVRDIAAEVGIQSGSIFHHFASKDAILYGVIDSVIRHNTERLRAARDAHCDPVDRLRALIFQELVFIVGDTREAMTVMVQEWHCLSEEHQKLALIQREGYERPWLEVLGELHQQGRFSTDPFIMRRLITGMNSWTTNWFNPLGGIPLEDLAETILERILGEGYANASSSP